MTIYGADDDILSKYILELRGPSIPAVTLLKDRGNALFKNANFSFAGLHYKLALKLLCFIGLPPLSEQQTASTLAFSSLLNFTFCELKLSNYNRVVLYCTFVLTFDPRNVKALYRRGLASKHLKFLTEALQDFEAALKFDPSNKDVNRELLSLVDQLAINPNGKRVALKFDPLSTNKKGNNHVSEVSPSAPKTSSCRFKKPTITDLCGDHVESVPSSDEMEFCPPSLIHNEVKVEDKLPPQAESTHMNEDSIPSHAEGRYKSTNPSAFVLKEPDLVFTNKNHDYKKLHMSTHDYNNLTLGKKIEFYHPRSGAVLRVRSLTHQKNYPVGDFPRRYVLGNMSFRNQCAEEGKGSHLIRGLLSPS